MLNYAHFMILRVSKKLLAYLVLILLIAIPWNAECQTADLLEKELVWSQPQTEVSDVQFSNDGNFIVFVTRTHWPDGEEAEGLPEAFFQKLLKRRERDPRFADPVVKLIDLKGKLVCEARYGTHPRISNDNKQIVFSQQVRPISGLRSIAASLAGNNIQLFDCETRQTTMLAQPKEGYLDDPLFLSKDGIIAYTGNQPINGAWGGPVVILETETADKNEKVLLPKAGTASVPCPPAGPAMSKFQAIMCAQPEKLASAFPDLILGMAQTDDELVVLTGKPSPAPGDIYLAKEYTLNLISVFPKRNELLSLGKVDMAALPQDSLQPLSGNRVMLFMDYWKPFSVQEKAWLPDAGPRNSNPRSVYSPDMQYYVAAEATHPGDEPDHFGLYRAENGQLVMTFPKMEHLYEATWSRDSKRLAMVEVSKGSSGTSYRDQLVTYSMP